MQLGIVHQRITPASPQENGTHERMHRELKRETARPAASSLRAQQRRFDAFRQRYNDERPHEGIGDRTPSSLWCPSSRPYPEHRTYPDYPAHMEIRRVSTAGTFRLLVASAVPQPRPRRRRHRPRRSRRWHLEHRLLQYVARQDRRAHRAHYRDSARHVRCKGCCRTFVNDHPVRSLLQIHQRSDLATRNPTPVPRVILERCSRGRTKVPVRGANHRRRIAKIPAAKHPVSTRVGSIH